MSAVGPPEPWPEKGYDVSAVSGQTFTLCGWEHSGSTPSTSPIKFTTDMEGTGKENTRGVQDRSILEGDKQGLRDWGELRLLAWFVVT